jgi:spore coat protein A
MLNRRRLLTLGGVAGGALIIPAGYALRPSSGESLPPAGHAHPLARNAAYTGRRPAITPFATPMPLLPVAQPDTVTSGTDHYTIPIQPGNAAILPGLSTPVLTYGGSFLSPTIRARTGRCVRVTFHNRLSEPTNVHLHGGHNAAADDGYPMDLIQPGQSRTYEYANAQRGATLWYHDHSHHTEAEHVYHGLEGLYLIDDPAEKRLGLPSGKYDVPILLRDAQFDDKGALLTIDPTAASTILANGKPQPYFQVAARKYRFRLLNGALEYTLKLSLGGATVTQIGSDGGLLPAPVPRTEFTLTPGERIDLVVDFSRYPVGSQVVLSDTNGPVLRFDVTRTAQDDSVVPDVLRALPSLPLATTVRDVVLSTQITGNDAIGLINGKPFDANRVDFRIQRGSTEIWRITNGDGDFGFLHNFHTHLVQFRALDRDGAPPTMDDAGLKDTIAVPAGKSVQVQATFPDMLGKYVFHCHFLAHSSIGMMAQMEIVP